NQSLWRGRIAVHPAADLFPMMPDDELDALAKDIEENGLQQPIVFLKDAVLDGRNRLAAIYRIKDEKRRERFEREIRECQKPIVLPFCDDPLGYVASANLHRRHLSLDDRQRIAAELLKANPGRSDRATAKIAGLSHPVVGGIRRDLEAAGDVEIISTRTD